MKKMIWIVGVILLVGLAGGGGFWAGMQYQVSQANQMQANFLQARGQGDGQMPGGGQFPEQFQGQVPGGRQGGGVTGEIKSLEGSVLTLSTAENVTTVTLSETTTVLMTVEGTTVDLEAGLRVLVTGERDSEGNLQATQIQILNSDPAAVRMAP